MGSLFLLFSFSPVSVFSLGLLVPRINIEGPSGMVEYRVLYSQCQLEVYTWRVFAGQTCGQVGGGKEGMDYEWLRNGRGWRLRRPPPTR